MYLWKGHTESPSKLDVQLNLEDVVHCDMGKAFIGLASDGHNSDFSVDIRSMSLQGITTFNAEDQWNGLSVSYNCSFPVDLVLSSTVLERYRNIFRLLFPLKCAQFNLNKAWGDINELQRLSPEDCPLKKLAGLRSKMTFFIDALLGYFYLDVLEVRWAKLRESLGSLKEFEELRRHVASYLESIYSHTFLNYPQIISLVFKLVSIIKEFLRVVQEAPTGDMISSLNDEFDQLIMEFLKKVEDLNSKSSSQYLNQLLIRMNFNRYYEYMDRMQLEGFVIN